MFWKPFAFRVPSATIALAVTFFVLSASSRCAADVRRPPQAFVKVNQFYFLYTYPVVPYLDHHGILMVGLEGMGRGLFDKAPAGDPETGFAPWDFGQVTTDARARRQTLTLGGHMLTFTGGSAVAVADGHRTPLESAARWAGGGLAVPAASLARLLGLSAHWDAGRRVLALSGPNDLTNFDWQNEPTPTAYLARYDLASLAPDRVTLCPPPTPPVGVHYPDGFQSHQVPWLRISVRNVSGGTITGNALNVIVLYTRGGASQNLEEGDPHLKSGHCPSGSPALAPGGVRVFPMALQAGCQGWTGSCLRRRLPAGSGDAGDAELDGSEMTRLW